MADDRTALLKRRAEQANQKYALLREGLEPEIADDVLGVVRWRPSRQAPERQQAEAGDRIPFHVPMTRAHRLATSEGATSFHFAHSFINKVSAERMEDGRRNRPGAARAHNRYVERETAVAILADAVDPVAASPSIEPTNAAGHEENEREREAEEDGVAAGQTSGRSEGADAGRPFLQRNLEILGDFPSGVDAGPGADLCLLSGFELVRHGRHPELLVQRAAEIPVDAGPFAAVVRQSSPRQGRHAGTQAAVAARTPSGHDRYIVRGGAVASQPDGDRALFTNIDADPSKRAEFWTLVEEHERSGGSDQMSCRFADRPDFWAAVVRRNDCPPALRDQYGGADHDEIVRFDIDSGDAMRKFLEQQDRWVAKDGDDQTFAKFHDGRAGRTQYRIVGELPNELPMAGKVQLLRDFTDEFRRRRIPFVAVMHAPDHNNDEKNWHFHLVYYDRPCARITAAQIAELERSDHDTSRLAPGMWDFAAVTVKRDRVNRELWPLRQKKVAQVGNDRWIKDLRRRFAALTNVQLEKADVTRRVDPRRHADMGIVADPQEHLGTRQAAAEARGAATAAGTRNEERQSKAILAQIDARRDAAHAEAARRVEGWRARLARRSGSGATGDGDPTARFEADLIAAADLDHLAATLQHADDRAASRARNLTRINGQLVRAIDADPSAGSRREHQRRADIVVAAGRYLHVLDVALRHDRSLVAECAAEAERLRGAAVIAEARLESLVTVPVSVSPPAKNVVPPVTAAIDPVEQWLRQVEARRPLIVTDGLRFTLAKGAMPVGVTATRVQTQLKTLYGRQQREIAGVVRQLPANRLSLSTRTIEGRKRHLLDEVDPALARSFFRYQDSPAIKAAIDDIFAGRFTSADRTRPPAGHVPVEIAREPSVTTPAASLVPSKQQAVPVIAHLPANLAPAPPVEPVPRAPIPTTPAPATVASAIPTPAMPPPLLDATTIARDLVNRNVSLTFDEDDRIDKSALLAAKVDPSVVETLQRSPFLIGRVFKQVEQALAQVQAHVTAKPLNLVRKGEQITLGGDAPAALIHLSRFHGRAPHMQERLRRLHDDLNAPEAVQPRRAVGLVEDRPTPTTLVQVSSDQPRPETKADILYGDAARQAALRASWQRGQ
ncbi:MobA/MobL protein domain-containing protein [Sphingomonas antarctica]|uniref:MobA/MobL family protein n=1 Tax=Sphingomonas antarctica TaxID=2040274 RepID=UPI0039E8C0D6